MKIWKILCSLCLFFCSCVFAQENNKNNTDEHRIFLTFNEKSPFMFMGKVDVNKAGASNGGMLYPGGNALVFFTAVLTHAAIENGVDHSRISKEQADANKVLDDYQPYIQKFNTAENASPSSVDLHLANGTEKVAFLTDASLKGTAVWDMNVTPIFFMTQNFGSVILYNKIVLQESTADDGRAKKNKKPAAVTKKNVVNKNEKVVVVISDPIAEPDFRHYWSNNEGARFLATLKNMYRDSLSLVVSHKLANANTAGLEQITVKYIEDGIKKVERGYVISTSCKRTLFESLSGEIKSVPNLEFLECPPSA